MLSFYCRSFHQSIVIGKYKICCQYFKKIIFSDLDCNDCTVDCTVPSELLSWTKFCSNLIISSCGRLGWNCIYHFPISLPDYITRYLLYSYFTLLRLLGLESNTMALWRYLQQADYCQYFLSSL